MPNWRDILLVSLFIIVWPITKLFHVILFLLAPIWTLVSFILLPFNHLAQTIYSIVTLPFSVKWLERIETLYVYLGTAALIGGLTGAVIFAIFKFISASLNIDSTVVPPPKERVRSAAEFRAAQREKREEKIDFPPAPTPVVLKKMPGSRRKGLLSQAIMEEEDSDF
ncbi:hypothetical protein HBI47_074490 [Parastagonospora nodorum]|nr:hypothetical protein HBI47_074490 [Parastagonospora nodorum]